MEGKTSEPTKKTPLEAHPTKDWYANIPNHGQPIKGSKVPEEHQQLLEARTNAIRKEIEKVKKLKKAS